MIWESFSVSFARLSVKKRGCVFVCIESCNFISILQTGGIFFRNGHSVFIGPPDFLTTDGRVVIRL